MAERTTNEFISLLRTNSTAVAKEEADKAKIEADKAQLEAWMAEAYKMTAGSFAMEQEDVLTKVYTSDGDGTFTEEETEEYSALHWAAKALLFNPELYATLTGATFTGQVKGITPIADADLTRKDYVLLETAKKVSSDNTETGTDRILNLISCTQAEYNALTPIETTLYILMD